MSQQTSPPRVHVLVRNPGHIDTRVRKTGAALLANGYDVSVFALQAENVPDSEILDGVTFERLAIPPLSRDHRRRAFRLRQQVRLRRYRTATSAARWRKEAAKALYTARRTNALGRVTNLRAMGARRERVKLAAIAALLVIRIARILLTLRIAALRTRRRLTDRHLHRHNRAARRWERRERLHAWRAEVWFYQSYARALLAAAHDRPAEIVHANDLNTLWAGWRLARRLGAQLVYDSHELELDRNTRWTPAKRRVAKLVESFCIRRAAAVITVSDDIADVLHQRYGLPERPTVVLNSPPLSSRDLVLPDARTVRGIIGLTQREHLLVYVGKVAPGRGIGVLIKALAMLPTSVHLALLGPREERYDTDVFERAAALGITARVHAVPSVEASTVPAVLRGTDVTVNASQNVCLSYDLALPNKLFDSVMAGVPTVVGSLRSMAAFVEDHEIGGAADERDVAAFAAAISDVLANKPAGLAPDRLDELQRHVAWESQTAHLLDVYANL